MQQYKNLTNGHKRLVWAGYAAYLIWIVLLHGWDDVIDRYIKPLTNNDLIDIAIMLMLYWLIAFIILWLREGFE